MLLRLIPEQVSEGWSLFAPLIQSTLPPGVMGSDAALSNALRAILAEEAEAWLEIGPEGQPRVFLLTTLMTDKVAGGNMLVIYTIHLLGGALDRESWIDGIETLKSYARSKGCGSIISHVINEQFLRFLNGLGIKAESHLITIPVN